MSLSRPIFNALGFYFEQLYLNPVRTKAITCSAIAAAGNYASQCIAKNKVLNHQSLLAYALFGLMFGGPIPHYFYRFIDRIFPEEAAFFIVKRLLMERLIFTPVYHAFALYMISRLEGKDHQTALRQLFALYWPVLSASWKYITVIQLLNFSIVPPMFHVLVMNIVGFFWTVYIANKRRQQQAKSKK